MTDRDCNFNCLDLFYNELDQCPCMSGKDTNLYQGRARRTLAWTSFGLPHQYSLFLSLIIGCPDGCPCPSFECEKPEIDHDPVPVEDIHLLLMPYENKDRLHAARQRPKSESTTNSFCRTQPSPKQWRDMPNEFIIVKSQLKNCHFM